MPFLIKWRGWKIKEPLQLRFCSFKTLLKGQLFVSFRKDGTFRITLRKSFQSCLVVLCSFTNRTVPFDSLGPLTCILCLASPGLRCGSARRDSLVYEWRQFKYLTVVSFVQVAFGACWEMLWKLNWGLSTKASRWCPSCKRTVWFVPTPVHDSLVPPYRKACFSGIKEIDATRSPFSPFPVFYLGALTVLHLH